VQLIGYARTARALLPEWTAADRAAHRVATELRALAPRNGSNLDAGLREAAAWLAREGGTHRVILFTDERLSDRTVANIATLATLLPRDTLVHVVGLSQGELERDDKEDLAQLAIATGGMFVRGGKLDSGVADATELVRPLALDHVSIHAADWSVEEVRGPQCGERILAGTSCQWWGRGPAGAGAIVVEGQLWGTNVHRVLAPSSSRGVAVARELSVAKDIDDDKLRQDVERAALAVNSAWSLLATWGGSGHYPELEGFGTIGFGACGCSSSDPGGFGSGSAGRAWPLDLSAQLAPVVAACHPGEQHVDVEVELTREEIVDVTVTGGTEALRACVSEGVWNITLSLSNEQQREHDVVVTSFGRP
jgi:hypothetical protein